MAAMGAWHIRELTDAGKKFGGGADTPTLCGLKAAWDVRAEITQERLDRDTTKRRRPGDACAACVSKFKLMVSALQKEEGSNG